MLSSHAASRLGAALAIGIAPMVAGAQSAWLLRPYLGDPHDARVPLFAQGRRGDGLLDALGRSLQ